MEWLEAVLDEIPSPLSPQPVASLNPLSCLFGTLSGASPSVVEPDDTISGLERIQ